MGKREGFGKCKGVGKQFQRKIRGRNKKTRENRRKMKSQVESKSR